MGCPGCTGNSSNSSDHGHNDCGCTSCFEGVMIPVGPQGPAGIQGATGATGPMGPQGEPGQDATIPALVWTPLTFANTWVASGSITPGFAVRDGLLYLRGIVVNNSYTALKQVIFTNAPTQSVAVQTMAFEILTYAAVQMQLLPGNVFQYVGRTEDQLRITLDSVPVIRLY